MKKVTDIKVNHEDFYEETCNIERALALTKEYMALSDADANSEHGSELVYGIVQAAWDDDEVRHICLGGLNGKNVRAEYSKQTRWEPEMCELEYPCGEEVMDDAEVHGDIMNDIEGTIGIYGKTDDAAVRLRKAIDEFIKKNAEALFPYNDEEWEDAVCKWLDDGRYWNSWIY